MTTTYEQGNAARSPSGAPVLVLSGVQKRYGGVRALRGVDLELQPGEVHAIVGENGAGKSTLIKIVSGAEVADQGSIRHQRAGARRGQHDVRPGGRHRDGLPGAAPVR